MQIISPLIPRTVRLPEAMIEDLLWDPVMAAEVLLGFKLDVFQACRLRTYWHCTDVMDSSGWSSGKTVVDWIFCALRNLLIPEQDVGVYFPVFQTGKETFWRYFYTCQSKIFQAHLGRMTQDGDEAGEGKVQGAAAFKVYYRNGGSLLMPAPSFMKRAETQASLRFNTLVVEEWPKIDVNANGNEGIAQLIGRCTKASWNQHHPIWGNHIIFSGTAETVLHPGVKRYKQFVREQASGNPNWEHVSFCYKDYSSRECAPGISFKEKFRIEKKILSLRSQLSPADWLGEGLGIWSENGEGWFNEELLMAAVNNGARAGLTPELGREGRWSDGVME